MLVLLWPVLSMHGQICGFLSVIQSLLISPLERTLLDDCLAAVDSHVARHVFGMSPHHLSPNKR